MKKIILAAAILAASSGPALAFMSLKSCQMISTSQGMRWLGMYCNGSGACVQAMFSSYCPYSL